MNATPVALLKTVMHQTLGDLTNIGEHLVAGFGHPFAVRLIGVERLVTHTLGSIGVNIVDGGALVQRRLALGFGGQQTGFRIEERGGWNLRPIRRCAEGRYGRRGR